MRLGARSRGTCYSSAAPPPSERLRGLFTAHIELLNSATTFQQEENEQRRVEGVLYWHKRRASEGGPPGQGAEDRPSGDAWFMMLESSLR